MKFNLPRLDDTDKYFLVASVLLPLAAWWFFKGRKYYAAKGMR